MPRAKLGVRELMCAEVLLENGSSVRQIATQLGVDESTLRYRLERAAAGTPDGRKGKPEACEDHAEFIEAWLAVQAELAAANKRCDPILSLYETLKNERQYTGTYKAVQRYVARRRPPPKLRPKRRVETRPGAQMQIDWAERAVHVVELGGLVALRAFCLTLSHSRMYVVVWRPDAAMLSWIAAHNVALTELNGVAAYARIDNLKTGVAHGAGPWAVINPGYESYGKQMGFVVDPCLAARGDHKGKVERRVRDVEWLQVGKGEVFSSLESLQAASDERRLKRARKLVCPVSGRSFYDTWLDEVPTLKPLPMTLPAPFDTQVFRNVGDDCLVSFEGRQYQVPFPLIRRTVEVRGCSDTVEILSANKVIKTYPRRTECRLLVDQGCYEGDGDDRVHRPTPLGRVARSIVMERSWEAHARSIEEYAKVIDML